MHLALSGLGRLERPQADAHRLFLADGLLQSGLEPDAILAAIDGIAAAGERQGRTEPASVASAEPLGG